MNLIRRVVVFDAADVEAVSAFWAAMVDGRVIDDDPAFHCVIDADGEWVIGVQRAPGHVPPGWPDGEQQVHLDLHAEDPDGAHEQALAAGAQLIRDATDPDAQEGHRVYADPAGHPFCIGWGHPSAEQLAAFVAKLPPLDGDG